MISVAIPISGKNIQAELKVDDGTLTVVLESATLNELRIGLQQLMNSTQEEMLKVKQELCPHIYHSVHWFEPGEDAPILAVICRECGKCQPDAI